MAVWFLEIFIDITTEAPVVQQISLWELWEFNFEEIESRFLIDLH